MRTTLIIDDNLLERASQLTAIREKTALKAGLEALIARRSAENSRICRAFPDGIRLMVLADTSVWSHHLRFNDRRG